MGGGAEMTWADWEHPARTDDRFPDGRALALRRGHWKGPGLSRGRKAIRPPYGIYIPAGGKVPAGAATAKEKGAPLAEPLVRWEEKPARRAGLRYLSQECGANSGCGAKPDRRGAKLAR